MSDYTDIDHTDINWELAPSPWPSSSTRVDDQPTGDDLPDALAILALGEANALRRVAELELERDTYRTLAQEAIHALHELQHRHKQQQVKYHELLDEARRLRSHRGRAA